MTINKPSAVIYGAAKVLGITGEITPEIVDKAYRRAAMKYHPDRNPGGHVMMIAVNAAREALKGFTGTLSHDETANRYGADLSDAINHLINCVGLDLEICGAWLWVSGATRDHMRHIKAFVADDAGRPNKFRWHSKKQKWYFAPNDYRGFRKTRGNTDMDDIREKYGSTHVPTRQRTAIAH